MDRDESGTPASSSGLSSKVVIHFLCISRIEEGDDKLVISLIKYQVTYVISGFGLDESDASDMGDRLMGQLSDMRCHELTCADQSKDIFRSRSLREAGELSNQHYCYRAKT